MGLRSLRLTQDILLIKEAHHHFMSVKLISSTFFKEGNAFFSIERFHFEKKTNNDFLIKPKNTRKKNEYQG